MGSTPASAAKNRGSERRTRHSSIHHQFDRIDVRRIVGGKEKHSFGQFFRFAPAAQRNRRGDEASQLSRLLGGVVLARAVRDPQLSDEILESVRKKVS